MSIRDYITLASNGNSPEQLFPLSGFSVNQSVVETRAVGSACLVAAACIESPPDSSVTRPNFGASYPRASP